MSRWKATGVMLLTRFYAEFRRAFETFRKRIEIVSKTLERSYDVNFLLRFEIASAETFYRKP